MLDQLSDTESVERPKPVAKSSDIAESIRHLPQTDLEAYANGRLPAARLDFCRTHLESCDACRAELEDIRTLQSDLSSFQRTEPIRREPERRRRRRNPALPLVVSGATVLVAAVSTILWWEHRKPRTHIISTPTAAVAQTTTAPAVVSTQTRDTHLANVITAVPNDVRPAAPAAIQHGKPQPPAEASRPRGPVASDAHTGFALLGPFGKSIAETRPEFTWQPLPGAIGYTVSIVDEGLHPVQHSPGLRATNWRPRHPLRPGQTYLWQVTATLHGGTKVVASEPSLSETALRINLPKLPDDMERFKQGHQDAHLILGALYAQAGMLTESAEQLKKVPSSDPSYNMAQAMLKTLPAAGQPAVAQKAH